MGGASAKEILLVQLSTCKTAANTCTTLASYPGSLIMWGQKREPGDYCAAHAPNVYANFPGCVVRFTRYDDL